MTSIDRPFVLIGDNNAGAVAIWERGLVSYGIEVVSAKTLGGLEDLFEKYQRRINLIVVDGYIPWDRLGTLAFVRRVRKIGFTSPMIVASDITDHRSNMAAAGCSHQTWKGEGANLAADLLTR